jgi:copper resistance protein B
MTALISARSVRNGWNWRRNRGLALTASGWFAALSVVDVAARASEPNAEVRMAENSQSNIAEDTQAPTPAPANSPRKKPADKSASDSVGPTDAMDMGPTPAPAPPIKETETEPTPPPAPMKGMDMGPASRPGASGAGMKMGSMQGGNAPPDARDPDAYAEGYGYSGMPGLEKTDQIRFGKVLVDELEYLSGNEGSGVNWTAQGNYGGDHDKLWLRTQGQKIPGENLDPTTGAEALWWYAVAPFWGSQLGVRQDFGPGAHTYLAVGVEGLAPRWFDIQVTGYIGDGGRLSARFKGSYDMRFTNRLILAPSLEANVYSKSDIERGLGAGLGNIEAGLRLRYEVHRKFAPYIGYVWERSFAGSANLRRAEGSPVHERRFVAGIRVWL